MNNNEKIKLAERIIGKYQGRGCELNYSNNFELLVAVILSAQCTDKRVNVVTKDLFKIANSPESMLSLGESKLKEIIKPCGFYNNKAKNIIGASKSLVEKFAGCVPSTKDELLSLSGVGEKTASVVLAVAFNVPAIAVDTHVFRLSKRLGFASEKSEIETMHSLEKLLPKELWIDFHYALVLHGRYVCNARSPKCDVCEFCDACDYFKNKLI